MTDLSIEYSLNTPVFVNSYSYSHLSPNILSKKIADLAKNNNNLSGGGGEWDFGLDMSDCISLLNGIILIILGFVLLWFKNNFVETEAIVKSQSCDEGFGCKINITYSVDSIQYSKIISMDKKNIPDTLTIKIYYQSSNPSSIQLYDPNYSIIGIGLIIIGIFLIIFSMGGKSNSKTGSELIKTDTNLYSSTLNID